MRITSVTPLVLSVPFEAQHPTRRSLGRGRLRCPYDRRAGRFDDPLDPREIAMERRPDGPPASSEGPSSCYWRH